MYSIVLSFILLSSLLVWYLLKHDHGRQLPVASLWIAFGFGLVGIAVAIFLELKLLPRGLLQSPLAYSLGQRLYCFLSVGFIEEAAKFVPLALFIYKKPYFKEHTDGVIYFAICGLTFGLLENIFYTVELGTHTGQIRMLLTPFFHAATTSILGYYLVSSKIRHSFKNKFLLAIILVPIMHGLYDFGLVSGVAIFIVMSLMLTLLLTLGLFLYFMEANDLDKAVPATVPIASGHFCSKCGRSVTGQSKFCENCGHPL